MLSDYACYAVPASQQFSRAALTVRLGIKGVNFHSFNEHTTERDEDMKGIK
jgi:hypothetical protein